MRPGNPLRWVSNQTTSLLRALVRLLPQSCSPHTPCLWVFLGLAIIYLALIRYCSTTYYRDPTSAFFDPIRGYQRHYSVVRQNQADAYIERHNTSPASNTPLKRAPKLCIGIATVARENEQYIGSTIGSLLEPLSPDERNEVYLAVLIAHTAPEVHPIYNEPWLLALVDKVLLYDVPKEQMDELTEWEKDKNFVRKAIFDYTYAMQKCVDGGAEWVAMVEDDTLAVMDWCPRLMKALEQVDDLHRADGTLGGGSGDGGEWLYLRMFFTEEFFGWNSEDWPRYLFASVAVVVANAVVLLVVRRFAFRSTLTNSAVVVWSLLCVPALVVLYFLAGKVSMLPFRPGVHQMPKFGCCAQGLVFSSSTATKTIGHLREVGAGFVDELIEAWANDKGYVRWAITPSLLQHIGGHSSKGDDLGDKAKWDRSVAEKIWNFGFELYDDRAF